jgi:hypothetical protein
MTAVLPSLADRLQLADGDHRSGLVTSGEDPAALRSVTRMELQLTYDMLGTRLRAIGGVEVTYRRMGSRPRTLGQWNLEYHNLGNRLRAIGSVMITYDRFGVAIHVR